MNPVPVAAARSTSTVVVDKSVSGTCPLTHQRAVVSISSNIAEGAGRPSDADFAHFLDQALGSAYEVETQLIISRNVGYITPEQETALIAENQRIQKQLIALIRNIRQSK